MIKHVDVYDLEVLPNFWSYTGINRDTDEINKFVFFDDKSEVQKFYEYLDFLKGMIGYNNLNYDGQLIQEIINKKEHFLNSNTTIQEICDHLYQFSQKIINLDKKNGERLPYYKYSIPQLDLFRIWHFDNKAKRQNLKGLEFHMHYENVQDLPFPHTHIVKKEEVHSILDYNLNDVKATKEFLNKSQDKINLRKNLSKLYKLDLINASNAKIGEELMLKLYCDKTGKLPREVKKLKTYRYNLNINEIIFPYIKFKSAEFSELLTYFKSLNINKTKGSISYTTNYKGFNYVYGNGGIHGCCEAGIYESSDTFIIKDLDVSSLYPSIAITNNLYPEHLGPEFCDVYNNDIVKIRLQEKRKKDGNKIIIDGFKEASNCVFGKSISEWSFLYDTKYGMSTTINGQLLLSMLAERLVQEIPDCKMLQANTDGLTLLIPLKDEDVYKNICSRWEKLTKLELEFKDYKKFIIRDVNNYTCIDYKNTIKRKGIFEIDKELHKDASYRIIPIALEKYFYENIPTINTILESKDIFDFCGWFRAQKGWEVYTKNIYSGEETKQSKSNRFLITKNGEFFYKKESNTNKKIFVDSCKGRLVTIFNKYYKSNNYDLDYNFYEEECKKIINSIIKTNKVTQQTFF